MKRVLITGKNSYVGTNVEKWLMKEPDKYYVESISVRGEEWKSFDFSTFDVVLHVAGIAHVSTKNKMKELYFKVNRDLTIKIAEKAKLEGIKQFIFMSSIIVYGDVSNNKGYIYDNTIPKPNNFYGESKLQAENSIKNLESQQFKIVIIRPPMIYGKNSKGNYKELSKLAKKMKIFPNVKNSRSMIHIDNLCEFIKLVIVDERFGLCLPQNKEYISTSELVHLIAKMSGKKIILTEIFNPIIKFLNFGIIKKVFGDLMYDKSLSNSEKGLNYQIRDFEESIMLSEDIE